MIKIISLLLMLTCHLCLAHPGIGIVKDSKGNIYYTDLVHVWKIAKDGKRTIAVRNVHTHELYMNANDELYGEHSWYNGERLNTWGHFVWRLRGNQKLDTIIKPSAGFLKNYSFVRDSNGDMYWAERDSVITFKRKGTDGRITDLFKGKFTDARWMHVTRQGILYFVDLGDLYKIASGKLILVAKNISHNTPVFSTYSGKHSLFGIWTDKDENVYVANYSGQTVKRISQNGTVKDFVQSNPPWGPTSGVFDKDGNLWLLEYSLNNKARARKIPYSALP